MKVIRDYLQRLETFNLDVKLALISASLVGFSVWGGIYTVLLNLYLIRLGYGAVYVGIINGAGLGAAALFSVPAGALGRLMGLRRVMIIGTLLGATGMTTLPLVEFVPVSAQSA